jgi:hypothetical protein
LCPNKKGEGTRRIAVVDYVYVGKGRADQYFKIGRTSDAQHLRLKQHRTANPSFEYHITIETQFGCDVEKKLHNYFCSKRVRETKEWFDLTRDDLEKIRLLAGTYENDLIPLSQQVEGLSRTASSGDCIEAHESVMEDYRRLRDLREQRARIEQEEELIENRLKVQIGSYDGIRGLISWKSLEQLRFDSKLFRATHPDLYDQFRVLGIRRYFKLL